MVESLFPSHVPELIINKFLTVALPRSVPLSSGTKSPVTELSENLPSHIALPTAIAVTVLPTLKLKKWLDEFAGGLYPTQTTSVPSTKAILLAVELVRICCALSTILFSSAFGSLKFNCLDLLAVFV